MAMSDKSTQISIEQNGISVSTDDKGFLYVKDIEKNIDMFIISFEIVNKPITYYVGRRKISNVLVGIKCGVVLQSAKTEFTASSFTDSRDEFRAEVGCYASFKRLFSSLGVQLVETFELTSKKTNNIFNAVRYYLDNKPIPIAKSNLIFM